MGGAMAADPSASRQLQGAASLADPQQLRLDFERTYLDGKMRRYSLLFAVNGGSFAILKLFSTDGGFELPGAITKEMIAAGAIVFTILMLADLWAYASGMRRLEVCWVACEKVSARPDVRVGSFTWRGRLILLGMSTLIVSGWTLAALQNGEILDYFLLADLIYIVAVVWCIWDWFQAERLEKKVLQEGTLSAP
jgi:hypothetical protein